MLIVGILLAQVVLKIHLIYSQKRRNEIKYDLRSELCSDQGLKIRNASEGNPTNSSNNNNNNTSTTATTLQQQQQQQEQHFNNSNNNSSSSNNNCNNSNKKGGKQHQHGCYQ